MKSFSDLCFLNFGELLKMSLVNWSTSQPARCMGASEQAMHASLRAMRQGDTSSAGLAHNHRLQAQTTQSGTKGAEQDLSVVLERMSHSVELYLVYSEMVAPLV